MTGDEYKAKVAEYTEREAKAKANIAEYDSKIASLKGEIDGLEADIAEALAEMKMSPMASLPEMGDKIARIEAL
ncbi:MAG: hypothetical protein IIA03_12340, partial [Proteobacteria bacterium]|nr:hypothetical protein [Pseudomonadota bacterium]